MLLLIFGSCAYSPFTEAADNLKIKISGIDDELLNNVQVFLSIAQENKTVEKKIPDRKVQELHRRATGEIKQALQPFGYYQPIIDSSLEKKENVWKARYKINKGPPTRIRKVEIRLTGEGRDAPSIRKALKSVKIAVGQRLRQQKYTILKHDLQEAAYAIGYLDAKYSRSQILVNPDKQRAEIYLILDTGPRYYFGDITIDQDILNPSFVDKFVQIQYGDPFESDRLIDLQFALTDSDYFSHVELQASQDKAQNQHVPVSIKTEPKKPQKYRISGGFGTDTGPRVGLGVLFRRVTRTGHQFRTDLEVSQITLRLGSQYKIPIGNIASEYLDFTATVERAIIADAISLQYTIGSSLNQDWLGGRRRLSLDFRRERFSFGNNSAQTANLLIPGISYSRQVADDPLFTRKGYSVALDLHGAAQPALSSTSFLQTHLSGQGVLPWAKRGRLLLRVDYGATVTTDFDKLPPSQRFYAGGARSVRGYAFRTLSPENEDGDDIGGRYLLVGSVEADYLLIGDFGAAVFFDAGDATLDPSFSLKRGVGGGLRYRSPVGMVRLDVAHPLDSNDAFRIHFSIGPDI
ncbi:Outer membrane protein [Nitrococcus mobilis Nb-231]|uniref:Translocation and assembly module subunit TamA n=1 Tax=Nitrococcus mobilis Nb-231 TaxID=314278 RepID=A4BTF3_9GAMM|nr:Outer membrane protein [Nitrococcus mobilis Nb-231]